MFNFLIVLIFNISFSIYSNQLFSAIAMVKLPGLLNLNLTNKDPVQEVIDQKLSPLRQFLKITAKSSMDGPTYKAIFVQLEDVIRMSGLFDEHHYLNAEAYAPNYDLNEENTVLFVDMPELQLFAVIESGSIKIYHHGPEKTYLRVPLGSKEFLAYMTRKKNELYHFGAAEPHHNLIDKTISGAELAAIPALGASVDYHNHKAPVAKKAFEDGNPYSAIYPVIFYIRWQAAHLESQFRINEGLCGEYFVLRKSAIQTLENLVDLKFPTLVECAERFESIWE